MKMREALPLWGPSADHIMTAFSFSEEKLRNYVTQCLLTHSFYCQWSVTQVYECYFLL